MSISRKLKSRKSCCHNETTTKKAIPYGGCRRGEEPSVLAGAKSRRGVYRGNGFDGLTEGAMDLLDRVRLQKKRVSEMSRWQETGGGIRR